MRLLYRLIRFFFPQFRLYDSPPANPRRRAVSQHTRSRFRKKYHKVEPL